MRLQHQPYGSSSRPLMAASPSYRLDEGYSEETRSLSEDTQMKLDVELETVPLLPPSVMSMSEAERGDLAYAILRSLRTSSIAAVIEKLNPLLHLDPLAYLPTEIIYEIFSYLQPSMLLRASLTSRAWRQRALDSGIWRNFFGGEGWAFNYKEIRSYEAAERARRLAFKERRGRTRRLELDSEQSAKKRVPEQGLFGDGAGRPSASVTQPDRYSRTWNAQHGVVEADDGTPPRADSGDKMEGVNYGSLPPSSSYTPSGEDRPRSEQVFDTPMPETSSPNLLISDHGEPRINWLYLFKQKRRLEDNWNAGRFTNFQLPHPRHVYEAHEECVYTIQYAGDLLVSGSRDKTLRIWNLETQRLVMPPLKGHTASVLCLQFDEKEDLIISGGSDTNVILWRLSTGNMIRRIARAHNESVLNLRFDRRYLVTCSKDKTIKVWSRKTLVPTDSEYPVMGKSEAKFPSYIISVDPANAPSLARIQPLPEYSLLMTLDGHGAAVNAIQILNDEIVSASGDRNVKIWDVKTGKCLKTLPGHTKGIACVQFDGRRVVSGSSDQTIRIFDRVTAAEVACLHGHSHLVRTVQARFGDLPGSEEDLEAEAREVDRKYFEARAKNPKLAMFQKGQPRNSGSKNPNQVMAYGAMLPPGGGGSRWARIVSGSYDETIIIWKKDTDGSWVVARKLLQEDAVRAASGRTTRYRHGHGHMHHHVAAANVPQPQNNNQNNNNLNVPNVGLTPQTTPPAGNTPQTVPPQPQPQPQPHGQQQQQAQPQVQPTLQQQTGQPSSGPSVGAAQTQHQLAQQQIHQQHAHMAQIQHLNALHQQQAQQMTQLQNQAAAMAGIPMPHPAGHAAMPMVNPPGSNWRVFKLQFDSRRIICCSQDSTIVGWDFANGDRDLMEASRFFGETS